MDYTNDYYFMAAFLFLIIILLYIYISLQVVFKENFVKTLYKTLLFGLYLIFSFSFLSNKAINLSEYYFRIKGLLF